MNWLNTEMDREVLGITTGASRQSVGQAAWANTYIDTAYKRGMRRADAELARAGILPTGEALAFPIDARFLQPIHADRVGLIYTRTFSELKGITDTMDQEISRILAQGIAEGRGPQYIARQMNKAITGKGLPSLGTGRMSAVQRSRILARTEVIRAHHAATINIYREAQVEGVKVKAEWATADDDRVCPDCGFMEGRIFTLDEIETLIPFHPQCRCVALPNVGQKPDVTTKGERFDYVGDRYKAKDGTFRRRGFYEQRTGKTLRGAPKAGAKVKGTPPSAEELARRQRAAVRAARRRAREAATQAKVAGPTPPTPIVPPTAPPPAAPPPTPAPPPAAPPTPTVTTPTSPKLSLENATKRLKDRYGVTVNVSKLGPTAGKRFANDVLATLDDISERFPAFKSQMSARQFGKKPQLTPLIGSKGKSFMGTGGNPLSGRYYTGNVQLASGMTRNAKALRIGGKAWDVGDDFFSVTRHEFGHRVYRPNKEEWLKLHNELRGNVFFSQNVSSYAASNADEAFAECFAAYTHPDYGKAGVRLPAKVEKFFEQAFGKAKVTAPPAAPPPAPAPTAPSVKVPKAFDEKTATAFVEGNGSIVAKNATKAQLESVLSYTEGDALGINLSLRASNQKEALARLSAREKQMIKDLDAMMKKAPELRKPSVVFRTVDLGSDVADDFIGPVGSEFVDDAYVSTTPSQEAYKKILRDADDMFQMYRPANLKIVLPENSQGIGLGESLLGDDAPFLYQKEFLLPRGTRFRVLERKVVAGVEEITLEVVT